MTSIRLPFILFSLSCLIFLPTLNADDAAIEYKIKAGYLYNFTKFITWPSDDALTFNICILGEDPFGSLINSIEQQRASGRPIKLFRLDSLTEQPHCQILFISSVKDLPSAKVPTATLTVGEVDGFAAQGGMIGFVNKKSRIKLQINLPAINNSSLKISAKLLEVGEIISGDDHD